MSKEAILGAIRRGLKRGALPEDQAMALRARLSAHPRHLVVLAANRLQSRTHRAQRPISFQMPAAIVHLFESVQIQGEHRDRLPVAPAAR